MRVLRVEYIDKASKGHEGTAIGAGCYTHGLAKSLNSRNLGAALNSMSSSKAQSHQPLAHNDLALQEQLTLKGMHAKPWMFCFDSIGQYHRWFNIPHLRNVCATVGRLAVYDVPAKALSVGSTQSIANADHVKLVKYLPLNFEGECT